MKSPIYFPNRGGISYTLMPSNVFDHVLNGLFKKHSFASKNLSEVEELMRFQEFLRELCSSMVEKFTASQS